MKQTVVIFTDYAEIRRKANRLYIETPNTKGNLPITNIDGILIYGKAMITSDAISLCISEGIPIILLSHHGYIKAQILPPIKSEHTNKRIFQYRLYLFHSFDVARFIVLRKLLEIEYVFDLDLKDYKLRVSKSKNMSELLGLEGSASKLMFQSFAKIIKEKGYEFSERNYFPPKDEINALLSFIYTIGYNLTLAFILQRGYDPYISFLHVRRGHHASFVSDVLEILRPKLTDFTATLLVKEVISNGDFEVNDKVIRLKRKAVTVVLDEFSQIKEDLLDILKVFFKDFEERNYEKTF